jgi:hypothetical protein
LGLKKQRNEFSRTQPDKAMAMPGEPCPAARTGRDAAMCKSRSDPRWKRARKRHSCGDFIRCRMIFNRHYLFKIIKNKNNLKSEINFK